MKRPLPPDEEIEDALLNHLVDRALEARREHGPRIDRAALERVLADRKLVRFPIEIEVSAEGLGPGEAVRAEPLEASPRGPWRVRVHPRAAEREEDFVWLVASRVPQICYGQRARGRPGALYAAALTGAETDDVAARLEELDRIAGGEG